MMDFLQGDIFPIYSCNTCSVMETVQGMRLDQTRAELKRLQCVHSEAAEAFFSSWEDHWTVDNIDETDLSYRVFCNQDIKVQTFCEEDRFLSAIQVDGEVTLLFTVGKKTKISSMFKDKLFEASEMYLFQKV